MRFIVYWNGKEGFEFGFIEFDKNLGLDVVDFSDFEFGFIVLRLNVLDLNVCFY